MKLSYDPAKSAKNLQERGFSFDKAAEFDWDNALIDEDARKPYPERRYQAVGTVAGRVHVLVFTPTSDGVRIISFRKANKKEIAVYEQALTSIPSR